MTETMACPPGAVGIFVKTPGISPVKTRLAVGIGHDRAENLYRRFLGVTESVVISATRTIPSLAAYWAIAETDAVVQRLWNGFPVLDQGGGSLGDRLFKIYTELLKTYSHVFLIGADSPQISIQDFKRATELLSFRDFVLGRCEDGGFYLFGGKTDVPKDVWTAVEYSQPDTAAQLLDKLRGIGSIGEIRPIFDVDTLEDLRKLRQLSEEPDWTTEQRQFFAWIRSQDWIGDDR